MGVDIPYITPTSTLSTSTSPLIFSPRELVIYISNNRVVKNLASSIAKRGRIPILEKRALLGDNEEEECYLKMANRYLYTDSACLAEVRVSARPYTRIYCVPKAEARANPGQEAHQNSGNDTRHEMKSG
jgi:hypothetical protein